LTARLFVTSLPALKIGSTRAPAFGHTLGRFQPHRENDTVNKQQLKKLRGQLLSYSHPGTP